MASIVAVEIHNDQLCATVARQGSGRNQLSNAVTIKLDGTDPAYWGEQLKEDLGVRTLRGSEMIAIVSRGDAEVREITVPPAPDDELPDMVKFKARSEFGSFNENWLLDYVPYSNDPEKERVVLAVAISPETQEQFKQIAASSGLKLKQILFRPFARLELLEPEISDTKTRLILESSSGETDIIVACGTILLTTRTVRTSEDADLDYVTGNLKREIKRTLASRHLQGVTIDEVVIAANEQLANRLAGELDLPTRSIDPFTIAAAPSSITRPESPERFSALLGAVRRPPENRLAQVDFLNPRRKEVKKTDLTRLYWIGGALAGVLALMLLSGWLYLRSQQSEISDLRATLLEKQKANDEMEETRSADDILAQTTEIDDFSRNKISWIDQLYMLSENSGNNDDAIVNRFVYQPATSTVNESRISIIGLENGEANRLLKLLNQGDMQATNTASRSTDDPDYERTYRIDFEPRLRSGKETLESLTQRALELRQGTLGQAPDAGSSESPEDAG
ncbi:MAG: hypothetical protein AAF456_22285 [Planctomycetota bacterium]